MISRELDVVPERDPEPAHAPLRSIVAATGRTVSLMQTADAERVLVLLSDDARSTAERRRALLADVLAPVVEEQGAAGRPVLAVTVDPAQVADLTALGFAEVGRTPLGAASLWLGVLRGGALPAPAQAAIATA